MTVSERLKYYWRYRWGIALKYGVPLFNRLQQARYGRRIAAAHLPDDPLFVIGHWRTGTTLVHELLSLDGRFRSPSTYEAFNPGNFFVTEGFFKERTRSLLPKTRPQDPMRVDWDLPQEDEFALATQGAPSAYALWQRGTLSEKMLVRFEQTLRIETLPEAEREAWMNCWTMFLRALRARREGRLLLKSPTHTFRLPLLERMFPAAQYVYMVRHPASVAPSTVHLIRKMVPEHNQPLMIANALKLFAALHDQVEAAAGAIPSHRFVTVRYEDLVADPVGQMSRIYSQLGLSGFDRVRPVIDNSLRARSEYRPNRHTLSPELIADIRVHGASYAQRHGYSLDLE
jgi:hypothetical protein